MSEEAARALGVLSSTTVKIAGKECTAKPLGVKDLLEVERICLADYKRRYLETFSSNIDLLPEKEGHALLSAKFEECARWDVGDLPPKTAYNHEEIVLTPQLREWVIENSGMKDEKDMPDSRCRRIASTLMDMERLTEDLYLKLSEQSHSPKYLIPYANWWLTGSTEGIVTLLWIAFRSSGITKDEIEEEFNRNMGALADLSREIERMSAPQAGNG